MPFAARCMPTFTALVLVMLSLPTRADVPRPQAAQEAAPPEETSELLVFLEPGTDVKQFARENGLIVKRFLKSDPNACVLAAPSAHAAKEGKKKAEADRRVRSSHPNGRSPHVRMAFVPDDPYFHRNTPASGWPGQWHLINEITPGLDARVQGAWNRDITGNGVVIGIVDDCLQTSHPDLSPNYSSADSWDFGQNDSNPSPVYASDVHGVSTAGVAAARGGNGLGVTGAAPLARLAGLRCDFSAGTTDMFVDATLYRSSGSNTQIKVKNHSYGAISTFVLTSAEETALRTSTAAGTIHCFAAGNSSDDANKWDLQNSPDAICVAALGSNGTYASYSNYGACVFVTCPSSSSNGLRITTTDRTGETYGYNGGDDSFPDSNYTSVFGGTSSASPLAAGVLALVKQVQPNLNVRFAKHLLAMTSDIVDPNDASTRSAGGWKTNAAGYHFNPNYGFGLIDADELTQRAVEFSGVTPETIYDTGTMTVGMPIPDNNSVGISRTYTVNASTPVEVVEVHLSYQIGDCTELEAWLTSPSGTRSRLLARVWPGYCKNTNWWFTSNEFWGESPNGTWTLTLIDWAGPGTATWNSFRVKTHMGALETAGPPAIITQPVAQEVPTGGTATFTVTATGQQPLSYQWQKNGTDLSDGPTISGATTPTLRILNCQSSDAGGYTCLVSNALGSVLSNTAQLDVVVMFIVESRAGGQNHDHYSEVGTCSDSTAKSLAALCTPGIGSRWAYMDRATYGINKAIYSFTPPVTGTYEVSVTWPASTNASERVEHVVTHAGGSSSILLDQDNVSNPSGANNWNLLGQYVLNAGTAYTMTQTNETYTDPGEIFRADAVRWRLVSGDCENPPTVATVTPANGYDDQVINDAVVTGTNFVSGQAIVRLARIGFTDILADDVNVTSATHLTCDFNLNGAAPGAWDVVVSTPGCVPARLTGAFNIAPAVYAIADFDFDHDVDVDDLAHFENCISGPSVPFIPPTCQPSPPPPTRGRTAGPVILNPDPLAYLEQWDTYALGTGDTNYNTIWSTVSGASRYTVTNIQSLSPSKSLRVDNNPGGLFGISNDLTSELQAVLPWATHVEATDTHALEAVMSVWMNAASTQLKYGDVFIELSMGDVHAPSTNSPTVLPVLAFGVTSGINGAVKYPWYFDGQNWVAITGATSVIEWNTFKMRVLTSNCELSQSVGSTYVATRPRAYLGGFNRISLRTVSNEGAYRVVDDVRLTGGVVVAPPCPNPPSVTSINPNAGRIGELINDAILQGSNFVAGQTAVTLVANGQPDILATDVNVTSASSLTCDFDLNGAAPGVRDVVVTTPNCAPATLAAAFNVFEDTYVDADFDRDGDVDQDDYGAFQACFSGANQPPPETCPLR